MIALLFQFCRSAADGCDSYNVEPNDEAGYDNLLRSKVSAAFTLLIIAAIIKRVLAQAASGYIGFRFATPISAFLDTVRVPNKTIRRVSAG